MNIIEGIKAYNLDWNPMTAEAYNEKANEVTMIFNFDITTEEKVKNVVQYIIGRSIWCHKNFPAKAKIILSFDIRGQNIVVSGSTVFKNKILELIDNLKIDNQISIEFLR